MPSNPAELLPTSNNHKYEILPTSNNHRCEILHTALFKHKAGHSMQRLYLCLINVVFAWRDGEGGREGGKGREGREG